MSIAMIENIGAYSQVDYDRGYQQGRADAIEEILKLAYCAYDGDCMCLEGILGCIKCSDYKIEYKDIEQLKEQTNDSSRIN